MSRPAPPTYKIKNWSAYNDALKRRGSLTIWVDPEMTWEARPAGKRGRQPSFRDAAIQTCLTMKVLFGMAVIGSAIGSSGNGAARLTWRKVHLGIDEKRWKSAR